MFWRLLKGWKKSEIFIITPATKYINGVIPQLDWGIQKVA
jgi:hypothetical protein